MTKNRNFFSQGNFGYYQQFPNTPVMQEIGYQNQDIDSRLMRIEREINRLDARISKLEKLKDIPTTTNNDYNFANSMYMV